MAKSENPIAKIVLEIVQVQAEAVPTRGEDVEVVAPADPDST